MRPHGLVSSSPVGDTRGATCVVAHKNGSVGVAWERQTRARQDGITEWYHCSKCAGGVPCLACMSFVGCISLHLFASRSPHALLCGHLQMGFSLTVSGLADTAAVLPVLRACVDRPAYQVATRWPARGRASTRISSRI